MYLLIDIGNTETKIFFYEKKYKKKIYIKSSQVNDSLLNKKVKNYLRKKKLERIICSSVVPNIFLLIKKFFKKKYGLKIFEIKSLNLNRLIRIKINKKQVGSDRLANAIGISNQIDNFIVIDFGTATTFDIIMKDKYCGGIIAPGVNLSLSTLISNASLIKPISLKKIKTVIGKNTSSAVRSGFFWGYLGLIENIIRMIKQKNKKSNFKIILTGGLSYLFKKSLNFSCKIDSDLTINGLLKVSKII